MLQRLVHWYRDPEQDLLRREVAWTVRWLRGWKGGPWLGVYLFITLAIVAVSLLLSLSF